MDKSLPEIILQSKKPQKEYFLKVSQA